LNFSFVFAPTFDAAALSQESPRQFHIATKTQTTIATPQILASMTFSPTDFTMERESVPHDANSLQSFASIPQKTNVQRKNTGAHDRIPYDTVISKHEASTGVHRQSLLEYDTLAKSM
jgi:hypothetical protein